MNSSLLLSAFLLAVSLIGTPAISATLTMKNMNDNVITATILDFGIYNTIPKRTAYDMTSPTGERHISEGAELLETTNRVPARIGTVFGFRYKIIGHRPGRMMSIKRQILCPTIINPENNKKYDIMELTETGHLAKDILFNGYKFDYNWELASGEWTIRIINEGKILAEKTFMIFVP